MDSLFADLEDGLGVEVASVASRRESDESAGQRSSSTITPDDSSACWVYEWSCVGPEGNRLSPGGLYLKPTGGTPCTGGIRELTGD